jgi:RHS repeat-associated protein
LKDHLGSIRAVVDENGGVMDARDGVYPDMLLIGNPWGHIIREYDNSDNDPTRNKFTGKERDWESGYDYFGARYYNSRIARWGQTEPLLEKYFSFSPYQYGLLNPMRLIDANGKDLYVGGDINSAFSSLQSLLNSDVASRLSMDDNGKISFNTEGLNVSDDAACELINNLVNSENNYLFEISSETIGYERIGKDNSERGNAINLNVEDISGDHKSGVYNFSKTQKMEGYIAPHDYLPKKGYDGQVTIGKGSWRFLNGGWQPKSNIIFHELAENYLRTEYGKYYADKNNEKNGAHYRAIKAAKRFNKQKGKAGEGKYVPS